MENPVTVKVSGLKELEKALEQETPKRVKDIIKPALAEGANIILELMKSFVPKDTGFLLKNLSVKFSVKGSAVKGSAFVGPRGKVDYPLPGGTYAEKINKRGRKYKSGRIPVVAVAKFIEFGTATQQPRPFMTQAFEAGKTKAMNAVIAAIQRALRL